MAFFRTGGGTDTSDANATAADILLSKTAYVDDEKITGTMPNNGDVSHTIGAGEVYNVPAGYTSGGTITAIAAGATITVTYTSGFYNKTMTCTKGQTTYTQTTTSSGSTTFSVAESGTWTITCNGVSRTVDVVLEYSTQMAITKTITVYSAASDTVSFTDVTGAKTVTTNTSGQGSVSITFIPPSANISFTSSEAKNPSDLSQAYSKTITITENTTSIYVMPDNCLYWYGYINGIEDCNIGGWSSYASPAYAMVSSTFNTRSINIQTSGAQNAGVYGTGAISGSAKLISQASYVNQSYSFEPWIGQTSTKTMHSGTLQSINNSSINLATLSNYNNSNYVYVGAHNYQGYTVITVYALWIE